MPINRALFIALLVSSLIACSGIKVQHDYNEQVDFRSLKSYAWEKAKQEPTGDPRIDNSLLDDRIRHAVDTSLTKHGYTKKVAKNADFLISYHYIIDEKKEYARVRSGFLIGSNRHYRRGFGLGLGFGFGGHARDIDVAELIIDIIDPATGKLIWRGGALRKIVELSDPRARTARVNETVSAILASFPPK